MKGKLKFLTNKNSILICILSIIVAFFSTFCIVDSNIKANEKYKDVLDFPDNFSYVYGDSVVNEMKIKKDFAGLNMTKFYRLNTSVTTNFDFGNRKVILIGVDETFVEYPLLFQRNLASTQVIEKQYIESGRSFTRGDMVGKTKTAVMNSCFLNESNYNGGKIKIENYEFDLVGSLTTSRMLDLYKFDDKTLIPIYIPYTTLLEFFINNDNISYGWTIETKGYRFEEYEADNRRFYSNYLYELEKNTYEQKIFVENEIIIFSMFSLSLFTTLLVQYILTKNKHYEIGIKRALGASQSDIVFEFQLKHFIASISGIILGVLLALTCLGLYCLYLSLINHINLYVINVGRIVIFMAAYFGLSCLASVVSLYAGAHINIASIIVEER